MLIRLDDINESGLIREYAAVVAEFPELTALEQRGDVVFAAPIATQLRAFRVDDMVEVEGTVTTLVRFDCSRCLKDFAQPLAIDFALTYVRELPAVSDEESGEDLELAAEDLGLELLPGDEIDLHGVIQEQVLLALPLQPLCTDTCRGLCPHCGADLNVETCSCAGDGFGGKFAALKDWQKKRS